MQLDLRVEVVVCAAREPYRGGRVGLDLHAGARLRKNEKIDAGFIHRRDAAIAEIFKQSLSAARGFGSVTSSNVRSKYFSSPGAVKASSSAIFLKVFEPFPISE